MSLLGMIRTSVSGMQGQANRLSAVADNIANSDTTGYKRYYTEFSQLVSPGVQSVNSSEIGSGGVLTDVRQSVSQQGTLNYTNSVTDLAINGNGFFVVRDTSGFPYLTRAGSFVPDAEGRLVNASGMRLAGYSLENGPAAPVANGYNGLQDVSIVDTDLVASPSSQGVFQANLPSGESVSTAPLPSGNTAASEFDQKTSLVVYDNLGASQLVDIYFTKSAADSWEVAVFNQADAAPTTGFPYATGPIATETLTFDLTSGNVAYGSANEITFTIPNGVPATVDLSGMTQLATDYAVSRAEVNGNAPSPIKQVDIDQDGTVYARYSNGAFRALYQIPLATVTSPDRLQAESGNVFFESQESGDVQLGFAGDGARGMVVPSALEQSNVDLAEELTTMIQSQRGYTANSKVFQTGSDLLDVLVNLTR
ncbi:MAG: flagellar hook protein FlgE [Rhizobiaceae bacterium]